MARLYPPHFAGIQAVEVHGDEEFDYDMVPEETNEELQRNEAEDEEPPITTDEHLKMLDQEAKKNEVDRMVSIPVMEEVNAEEVKDKGGYLISTKFVYCWKHRIERGGWFRRARLVARQFKSSVDMEQTFAPTSMLVIPKMLINLMLNVFKHFTAMTLDIKDAFLMAAQPEEEKAYVEVDDKVYSLQADPVFAWTTNSSVTVVPAVHRSSKRIRHGARCHAAHTADDSQSDIHHSTC